MTFNLTALGHPVSQYHASQPGLFKTGHPAAYSRFGPFYYGMSGFGCRSQQIHIAETVVGSKERIGPVDHGLHLSADTVIIHRRSPHNDIGLPHQASNLHRIVVYDTLSRLLTGQTPPAKGNPAVGQIDFFHPVAGLTGSPGKLVGQAVGIAAPARTGRNNENLFFHGHK